MPASILKCSFQCVISFSVQNALVIKVPHLPMAAYCTNNVANIQICVTAGKGDRTGKEPLKSNVMQFYCVVSGENHFQYPQYQGMRIRQPYGLVL